MLDEVNIICGEKEPFIFDEFDVEIGLVGKIEKF